MTLLTSMYQQLQGQCFKKCVDDNDVAFMTINEGKCFRNCMTKMSYFHPTLRRNLEGARFYELDAETKAKREELGVPEPDFTLGFD